jgi:hypothetical protein
MKTTIGFLLALGLLALGCKGQGSPPPAAPAPAAAEPSAGLQGQQSQPVRVGQPLAGADAVSVEALVRDPKAFEGKIVRVSGKVEDWCRHAKGWFAVSSADGRQMVRVIAAPRFTAPDGTLGKFAVAEGKVEVVTLSEEQVQYYAKEHKFLNGVAVEPGKPVYQPIVQAFGAELQ